MKTKQEQSFTLDDLGIIAFPLPQIDGSDDFKVDMEELRKSDARNKSLREAIRRTKKCGEELEQM